MMKKAYLLTGEPGIGKTTALKKVIAAVGFERCGGFYTVEVSALGQLCGYRLVTLDGQAGTLADITLDSPLRVGKYGVRLQSLEDIGLTAIPFALASKSFVVIDEIGPMQLYSPLFKLAVMDILTSSIPLIGTVSSRSDPWLDELKQRSDVELYPLTHENREEVPRMLVKILENVKRGKNNAAIPSISG